MTTMNKPTPTQHTASHSSGSWLFYRATVFGLVFFREKYRMGAKFFERNKLVTTQVPQYARKLCSLVMIKQLRR